MQVALCIGSIKEDDLEVIQSACGIHFRVETAESPEEYDTDASPEVVFYPASFDSLNKTRQKIDQLKQAYPEAGLIGLLTKDPEGWRPVETESLFLKSPMTEFEVQSALSGAMQISTLQQRLGIMNREDEVEGLYNRRYFLHRVDEEMSLARRHLSPLACVVISVRFLPMYVDSYGYQFLQSLFRHLHHAVHEHIRQEDIVARLSDEEVAILLPRSTEKGARVLANRILMSIQSTTFDYDGNKEDIEPYAGIAGYPFADNSEGNAETVVRYARHALHRAKCQDKDEKGDDDVAIELFSNIQPAL